MDTGSLHTVLRQGLKDLKWNQLTPIQSKVIPLALEGKDILALAQTGTGKTGAFLIPTMHRFLSKTFDSLTDSHFCLIVVPTRELVNQIDEVLQGLGQKQLKSALLYGGVGYEEQAKQLEQKPKFVIATPGRLIDFCKQGSIDFSLVKTVIFDEADRLFDLGFEKDIKFILSRMVKNRQILLFSATYATALLEVVYEFGANPLELSVEEELKAEKVEEELLHVGASEKPQYLLSIIKKYKPKQVIVFSLQNGNRRGCSILV